MQKTLIPEGYKPALNLHDTQIAIKTVKDAFPSLFALSRLTKKPRHAIL